MRSRLITAALLGAVMATVPPGDTVAADPRAVPAGPAPVPPEQRPGHKPGAATFVNPEGRAARRRKLRDERKRGSA